MGYITSPLGSGGGGGGVSSVAVSTANGFAGTVANPTTTPNITIKTTITGIIKGNGTAISAATGDTDYQNPITLTTTGTSGAATFSSDTLNIPNYSTSPGGSNTQVQYNNSSAFAGITGATSDGTNLLVTTQSASDNSTKSASTAYVTTAIANAIAGVNPAVAVVAATTQASDTSGLTYNNGVSGIGATFTGSVNTALTFDGQTLTSVNQRVLIKNDTQSPSGAFNGIYYLTQLQTGILAPILTRALDYDAPSDINNTGAIPVVNGTVNANTSWLLTSTVNTVGTDPLTYVQFSVAPSTIVTLTGTQTLTNKRITKRVTTAADATSITPNTDSADITYQSNSQAGGTLTINADGGTPTNGQSWALKIKSTNVQTFSWTSGYVGGTTALPTASTGGGKIDYWTFIYDTVNSKWHFTGQALGF